jgi:hypothetical protein
LNLHRYVRAVITAAVLFILPAAAAAQQAGVKAGVNFASISDAEGFINTSQRIGLVGGVWVVVPANRFSFQIEGLLSEKGVGVDISEGGVTIEGDIRIRYVEVPVLGRFDFGADGTAARFFVVGGAAPAFKVGDARIHAEFEGEEETEVIEDIESFDLGLVGGIGVQFGRANVEARYTHGLMKLSKDADEDDNAKNRVFTVTFGFRFR